MHISRMLLIVALAFVFQSCGTIKKVDCWRSEERTVFPYRKIMVAAIVNEKNDSLRWMIENKAAAILNSLGYHAVSTATEFEPYELNHLGQEATYLSLCNNGIDAVLTIALVPERYSVDIVKAAAVKYTSQYYYDHVWAYHNLEYPAPKDHERFKWEMILFDITQLAPRSVQQSGSSSERQIKARSGVFAERAIGQLIKTKVLIPMDTLPLRKPF